MVEKFNYDYISKWLELKPDMLIREEVEKIGGKQGGLMLLYGLYPGVPLENARALMDAMERYSSFYN